MQHAPPPIRVGEAHDGTLTYLVEDPPGALPPVHSRDLAAAWERAREAARAADWGVARLFRFRQTDGTFMDLALADADARCWAGAVDVINGIGTRYGLSLCLRLLALVDLLARAPWAAALCRLGRGGADLDPALLRAAATAQLTNEAGFDETALRVRVAMPGRLPQPGAFA